MSEKTIFICDTCGAEAEAGRYSQVPGWRTLALTMPYASDPQLHANLCGHCGGRIAKAIDEAIRIIRITERA